MPTRRSRSSASASRRRPSGNRNRSALTRHVEGLLAGLGPLTSRPMFGGHGFYCGGVFFGFVLDGVFYLKADPRAGLEPFVWKGRRSVNYYRAPAEALESPDAALEWAREALAAALRSKKKT